MKAVCPVAMFLALVRMDRVALLNAVKGCRRVRGKPHPVYVGPPDVSECVTSIIRGGRSEIDTDAAQ